MNFSDAIARGQVFTVRFFHLLFVGNVFIRGVTHQKKKNLMIKVEESWPN